MTLPKLWNQVRQWIQRPPFPLDPNRSHLPWTISTGVLLALLTLLGLLGQLLELVPVSGGGLSIWQYF
jgi:hypothetical protein